MGLAGLLKTNFLDQSGQNTLTISQKMPVGTSLAATDAAAKKVEDVLAGLRRGRDLPGERRRGGSAFGVARAAARTRATYSVTLEGRTPTPAGAARTLRAASSTG